MNKEEKEARLVEHVAYWNLVDKIRDMSLDALDDLSISDVISALDRIKVELIQQEVIVTIEETQGDLEEGEEEPEIESEVVSPQASLKSEVLIKNPTELMEEVKKSLINN